MAHREAGGLEGYLIAPVLDRLARRAAGKGDENRAHADGDHQQKSPLMRCINLQRGEIVPGNQIIEFSALNRLVKYAPKRLGLFGTSNLDILAQTSKQAPQGHKTIARQTGGSTDDPHPNWCGTGPQRLCNCPVAPGGVCTMTSSRGLVALVAF